MFKIFATRKEARNYDVNVGEKTHAIHSRLQNRGVAVASWYHRGVNSQSNNVIDEEEKICPATRTNNDSMEPLESSQRVETTGEIMTQRLEFRPRVEHLISDRFLPDIFSRSCRIDNVQKKIIVYNDNRTNNSVENTDSHIKSNSIATTKKNFIDRGSTIQNTAVRESGKDYTMYLKKREVIRPNWRDSNNITDVSSTQVQTTSRISNGGTDIGVNHQRLRTDFQQGKPASRHHKNNNVNHPDKTHQDVLGKEKGDGSKDGHKIGQVDKKLRKRDSVLCPASENKKQLCEFVDKDVIGAKDVAPTPFGLTKITYLDYIASARSLTSIERYLQHHVIPTYSNTHTEVNYNAKQTSHFRKEAKDIIRECVNASKDDMVIFTGSGATSAVNKLVHALNIRPEVTILNVTVFIGPYEHHSNILAWREIKANVIAVPQTEAGSIDLQYLSTELQKCQDDPDRLLIGSFSAASNVTGILTDVDAVASLMHDHGGYAFFDYACAGPYTDIDMNPSSDPQAYKDAVFVSPHKFIGGPQTPGILIAKRWLFQNPVPHNVGGGTVSFVRRTAHMYLVDIEDREEGGTPAIIESVRAGLVFKLKAAFTPGFIMRREAELLKHAIEAWLRLPGLVILGSLDAHRLPIFSMVFLNLETGRFVHHNFVATVFNDVFGIQVRSGCSCAGPYGMDLLGMTEKVGKMFENLIITGRDRKDTMEESNQEMPSDHARPRKLIFKPGFVRLSLPYFMSDNTLAFVLKAIQMTSEKAWLLLPQYNYDRDTGRWWHKDESNQDGMKRLQDVTFKEGQIKVKKPLKTASHVQRFTSGIDTSDVFSQTTALTLNKVLKRAERTFAEAKTNTRGYMSGMGRDYLQENEEALRWFMLPSEAVDIINGRKVPRIASEDLPFVPETLKWRIKRDQQKI